MHRICWQPNETDINASAITNFMHFVNASEKSQISNYSELYQWSINQNERFWALLKSFCQIEFDHAESKIVAHSDDMIQSRWFPGAHLNFAKHLLRHRNNNTAIVFQNEHGDREQLSYNDLYQQVAKLSTHMHALGVGPGDRVAGFVANSHHAVIAMLATTSLGAVWTACSPDFGIQGIIDRFGQIEPKLLVAVDSHYYGNKVFDDTDKLAAICKQLPHLEQTIVIPYTHLETDLTAISKLVLWSDCLNSDATECNFAAVEFNDPLYILYSSGTTGKPKCMVHSVGGVLLQHLKELQLHTDLRPDDVFFYYTTCGWMMWNWLVSGLSLGCTIVLYDGSPFHPKDTALLDLIDEYNISVFGIGAKYIEAIHRHKLSPKATHRLDSLKTLLSTGSPLLPESFDYIYDNFPPSIRVSSISGGSDIVSCFALGNPILPVRRGELQCRGLGMAVDVYNDDGQSIVAKKGELVCTKSFPSMPIYFWNDKGGERYRNAYFTRFDNVWAHGDYAELCEDGGMIIYGRSDATLNPSGVRVGTAEIYSQLDQFDSILDCVAVGQRWRDSERIVLFVIMQANQTLTDELKNAIKQAIKQNCSPHHVPAKIIAVNDIPKTISGKPVEIAVKKVIHGEAVDNTDALANPEALSCFKNIPELAH